MSSPVNADSALKYRDFTPISSVVILSYPSCADGIRTESRLTDRRIRNDFLKLNLTAAQKADLVEFLKSI